MFDKLLKKKRKITQQSFEIPTKNFNYDSKIVGKLPQKDLIALIQDQDKYITTIVKKLQDVRDQYGKTMDKCDELAQKNDILNSDFKKVNNQHEELLVKHKELQQAIQLFANEKQRIVESEVKFLCDKNFYQPEKLANIKELQKLLEVYRSQIDLCRKIQAQNKRLKVKFNELEEQIRQISDQAKKNHEKSTQQTQKITAEDLELMNQQLQEKLKLKKQAIDQLTKLAKSEMDQISELKNQLGRLSENDIGSKNTTQEKSQEETQKYCQCDFDKEILQQQQDKFNEQIENLKHEIIVLKDKVQQIKGQLDRTIIANKQASTEILSLSAKAKDSEQKFKQYKQQMQTAKQKAQQKQTLLNQLKENMQTYHQIERNHIILQKQNEDLKNEKKKLQSQNKDIDRQLKQKIQEQEVLENKIAKFQNTISQNQQTLKNFQDEVQSKQRKHDYEINQERIKKQQMERTILVLEGKNQQANKGLQAAYAEIQIKNKKIHLFQQKIMDLKNSLKEIKREKEEKQYKIKELTDQIQKKNEQNKVLTQVEAQKQPENIVKKQEDSQNNQDNFSLKKKIISLEQENNLLLHENKQLTNTVQQLSNTLLQNEQQIKKLHSKRQQSIKEIQRLSQVKNSSRSNTMITQPITPRQHEIDNQRQKKLANKAYRGFDILLKLHTQLYKDYIRIFQKQLKDANIQSLQKAINLLVNKSTDMKDIFADYL